MRPMAKRWSKARRHERRLAVARDAFDPDMAAVDGRIAIEVVERAARRPAPTRAMRPIDRACAAAPRW